MSANSFPYRILFVEDDLGLRTTGDVLLRSKGYEVLCAEDGFEGLVALKRSLPDIIISDRDHLFEKSDVQDRRALYETALQRGMGEVTYTQVRQEVERRFDSGEFRQASASVRGPQITTAAMLRTEREIIDIVQ